MQRKWSCGNEKGRDQTFLLDIRSEGGPPIITRSRKKEKRPMGTAFGVKKNETHSFWKNEKCLCREKRCNDGHGREG